MAERFQRRYMFIKTIVRLMKDDDAEFLQQIEEAMADENFESDPYAQDVVFDLEKAHHELQVALRLIEDYSIPDEDVSED